VSHLPRRRDKTKARSHLTIDGVAQATVAIPASANALSISHFKARRPGRSERARKASGGDGAMGMTLDVGAWLEALEAT